MRHALLQIPIVLFLALPLAASTVYITSFSKSDNIYTDLNQQFPNTGPGVPGSGIGTPDQSFTFNPSVYKPSDYVAGSNLANNGINFDLTSNATGQDFYDQSATLNIPLTLKDASAVYMLVGSYAVVAGTFANLNVSFGADNGASESFSKIPVLDFNDTGNQTVNNSYADNGSATTNLFDQTVFEVDDTGAGGTGNSATGRNGVYDLTELTFLLSPDFNGTNLTSITFQGTAYTPFLLGITIESGTATMTPAPEPAAWNCMAIGLGLLLFGGWRWRGRRWAA